MEILGALACLIPLVLLAFGIRHHKSTYDEIDHQEEKK